MMIETRGLRKSFGDHVVLDGIDLDVAAGAKTIFMMPCTLSLRIVQRIVEYGSI